MKTGKQSRTAHCFGCKDYTNKILRKKSHCVICRSNKSRFLKQKLN